MEKNTRNEEERHDVQEDCPSTTAKKALSLKSPVYISALPSLRLYLVPSRPFSCLLSGMQEEEKERQGKQERQLSFSLQKGKIPIVHGQKSTAASFLLLFPKPLGSLAFSRSK